MRKILLVICSVLSVGCQTYTIEPESLKNQIYNSGNKMQEVAVNNPLSPVGKIAYKANTLKGIVVINKKGFNEYLENSPSIEMRITQKNGKRRVVYFDTVELRNDTLYGSGSRFVRMIRKIPFDSIAKIGVQDGGKKFYYQN